MTSEALKPCPFCNSSDINWHHNLRTHLEDLFCDDCGATMKEYEGDGKQDVIDRWNTRACASSAIDKTACVSDLAESERQTPPGHVLVPVEIIQNVQSSLQKAFVTQSSLGDPNPEKRKASVNIEYRKVDDMQECYGALAELSKFARAMIAAAKSETQEGEK